MSGMVRVKPCLDCPTLTTASRCSRHEALQQRARSASRLQYRGHWTTQSRKARKEQPWCSACGAQDVPLHNDHILPVSQGGTNDKANTQVLCIPCHKAKTTAEQDGQMQAATAHKPAERQPWTFV